jgi:MFS family permease
MPLSESPLPSRMKWKYKWLVVGMLWMVCVLNYGDRQAFFSAFPRIKGEFGFSPVQFGLMGSAFAWVYAFGSPLAGFIGDRVKRKGLILGGCAFWSVTTAATGLCGQVWQFVGVRALTGVGEAFYFPSALSLLSSYHDRRTRSLALSLHQSGVYVGTIGGSWAGAWLAERYGWRIGFNVFGAAGTVLSLVLYRFLREPDRGVGGAPVEAPLGAGEALHAILSKPTAIVLMLAFVGANFVATIFLAWTPTFLVEKFHLSLTSAGFYGSAFISVASMLSVPLGGLMADRLAKKMPGGRILVQAAGLLAGAIFVAIVGLTAELATLVISMTVFGLCKGLYDSNIFASLYDVVEPRARASAAGVMNTVGWLGGALGPLAVGIATQYGRHGSDTSANMGDAIAFGAAIYAAGGLALLVAATALVRRDIVGSAAA